MTFRIAQDFTYVGRNTWDWRAWIESADDDLSSIATVTWVLHPSFTPNRVTVENRSERFALERTGWGTFRLRAELTMVDGEQQIISRSLVLQYPTGSADSAPIEAPSRGLPAESPTEEPTSASETSGEIGSVFLSYGHADKGIAAAVRTALESENITVFDETTIQPGSNIGESLRSMIDQADAVIGIAGRNLSPFVTEELEVATREHKPSLVFASPDADLGDYSYQPTGNVVLHGGDETAAIDTTSVLGELRRQL